MVDDSKLKESQNSFGKEDERETKKNDDERETDKEENGKNEQPEESESHKKSLPNVNMNEMDKSEDDNEDENNFSDDYNAEYNFSDKSNDKDDDNNLKNEKSKSSSNNDEEENNESSENLSSTENQTKEEKSRKSENKTSLDGDSNEEKKEKYPKNQNDDYAIKNSKKSVYEIRSSQFHGDSLDEEVKMTLDGGKNNIEKIINSKKKIVNLTSNQRKNRKSKYNWENLSIDDNFEDIRAIKKQDFIEKKSFKKKTVSKKKPDPKNYEIHNKLNTYYIKTPTRNQQKSNNFFPSSHQTNYKMETKNYQSNHSTTNNHNVKYISTMGPKVESKTYILNNDNYRRNYNTYQPSYRSISPNIQLSSKPEVYTRKLDGTLVRNYDSEYKYSTYHTNQYSSNQYIQHSTRTLTPNISRRRINTANYKTNIARRPTVKRPKYSETQHSIYVNPANNIRSNVPSQKRVIRKSISPIRTSQNQTHFYETKNFTNNQKHFSKKRTEVKTNLFQRKQKETNAFNYMSNQRQDHQQITHEDSNFKLLKGIQKLFKEQQEQNNHKIDKLFQNLQFLKNQFEEIKHFANNESNAMSININQYKESLDGVEENDFLFDDDIQKNKSNLQMNILKLNEKRLH
jgi:uncharacterized protein YbcV (DUF1398 family)